MVIMVILYTLVTVIFGWYILRRFFPELPVVLIATGAFLVGTAALVPVTYLLSCIFHSLQWGVIATMPLGLIGLRTRFKFGKITSSEWLLILFAAAFSIWLMLKTFHGGAGGGVYVGSNNIFDFGFAVGLIRSMSWGTNIPIREPFFAGLPIFYHYFFVFWVAIWEYFGVPIVWAMNIPSILSFASLLIVIYYLPQLIAKQKPIIGWIAMLLTITNSSLTFWQLLLQKGFSVQLFRDIWRLPTYPFAGPFDGSTISIFMTLNNYTNQRHLAFATALGLFLILCVIREMQKKILPIRVGVLFGLLTGLLLLWNMVTCLLVAFVISVLMIIKKQWNVLTAYIVVSCVSSFMFLLPIAGFLYKTIALLRVLVTSPNASVAPSWNIVEYLWQNVGILPIVAALGFVLLKNKSKQLFIPFVLLFIGSGILAVFGKRGFDQKLLTFFLIGINILAAVCIGWVWDKRMMIFRFGAISLFIVLTISGIVDLFPIKNEFAFPLIGKDSLPVISWIHKFTPTNSVFISYEDMVDPVVLAGRTNYNGFFKNVGFYDRSPDVRRVYGGDIAFAKTLGISYILVPKWQKNDFSYVVDTKVFAEKLNAVYEDDRFIVYTYKVNK